jgi:hypothetical protein
MGTEWIGQVRVWRWGNETENDDEEEDDADGFFTGVKGNRKTFGLGGEQEGEDPQSLSCSFSLSSFDRCWGIAGRFEGQT